MPDAVFSIRFRKSLDGASIDRVRNFGEELMTKMRPENLGTCSDPDTAIDELRVSISSPRHLGTIRQLIRKLLAKHRLDADLVITATNESSREA